MAHKKTDIEAAQTTPELFHVPGGAILVAFAVFLPRYLVQSYSEFGPGTKRGLLWLSLGQASENYLFNFIFFLGYTFHE